ncbi:MAG: RING finger protein [Planctomycetota bacterium]
MSGTTHELLAWQALDLLDEDERAAWEEACEATPALAQDAARLDAALAADAASLDADEVADGLRAVWERVAAERSAPATGAGPALEISVSCAFCHDRLTRADAVYCASCLAPHHAECFAEHGRCSALGCEETHAVRPARLLPAQPTPAELPAQVALDPRRKRALAGVVAGTLSLLVGIGVAAKQRQADRALLAERPRVAPRRLALTPAGTTAEPAPAEWPPSAPLAPGRAARSRTLTGQPFGVFGELETAAPRLPEGDLLAMGPEQARALLDGLDSLVLALPIRDDVLELLDLPGFVHQGGGLVILLGGQELPRALSALSPMTSTPGASGDPEELLLAQPGHPAVPALSAWARANGGRLPPLSGRTTPALLRPGAAELVRTADGLPVLAAWDLGLGRVVCFGGRAGSREWASALSSESVQRLWSDLCVYAGLHRDLTHHPDLARVRARVERVGGVGGEELWLDAGSSQGLRAGDELELRRPQGNLAPQLLAHARVEEVEAGRARARLVQEPGRRAVRAQDEALGPYLTRERVTLDHDGALAEALAAAQRQQPTGPLLEADPAVAQRHVRLSCRAAPLRLVIQELAALTRSEVVLSLAGGREQLRLIPERVAGPTCALRTQELLAILAAREGLRLAPRPFLPFGRLRSPTGESQELPLEGLSTRVALQRVAEALGADLVRGPELLHVVEAAVPGPHDLGYWSSEGALDAALDRSRQDGGLVLVVWLDDGPDSRALRSVLETPALADPLERASARLLLRPGTKELLARFRGSNEGKIELPVLQLISREQGLARPVFYWRGVPADPLELSAALRACFR